MHIQIIVALTAFLLLHLAQTAVQSPLAFAKLVRANLMQRRRINCVLDYELIQQDHCRIIQWC